VALALRLGAALLLFTVIVMVLYLVGAAQSFSEDILRLLFLGICWLSWGGLLTTVLVLIPWARHRKRHIGGALAVGMGFALFVCFVLVWGSWVYPSSVVFPW